MIAAITQVWSLVLNWLATVFPVVTAFFYDGENLTFMGLFAVVMAGVALVLLVFNLIRSFLPMRG